MTSLSEGGQIAAGEALIVAVIDRLHVGGALAGRSADLLANPVPRAIA